MSDRARRDAGMTLPELLIAISIIGLIAVALSGALVVTLRQQDNTNGRLNVAAAEQSVSMWIPADLASADTVDTDPSASPCGATVCGGIDLSSGSNVLLLSWTSETLSGSRTTNVSYHFRPDVSGTTYELLRVECVGSDCSAQVVLGDLPGPPGGEPFIPGVGNGTACSRAVDPVPCTRPDWVIIVSEPLRPDAVSDDDVIDPTTGLPSERKDANRVIVTINGGGDADGAGGGINQISITAGGTVRQEIAADSVLGAPSFVEARSRCGGPMTLVIDESNSIGNAISDVKTGVRRFVESLAGTPVELQVVRFHTYGSVLGSGDWHHYFDMTDPADVSALLAAIDGLRGSWPGSYEMNGGTNWEEAMFRTFFGSDGSTAATIPETIVFFTDGVPTFDRLVRRRAPGVVPNEPPAPGPQWPASTGYRYSQVAFNRANHIASQFRNSVRFIGVGVGTGIGQTSTWMSDPGAGYRYTWERAYRQYQRTAGAFESNIDVERASSWTSNIDFERRSGRRWRNTTPEAYYANNVDGGNSDGWRINGTRSWYYVTEAEYDAHATAHPGGFQIYTWTDATREEYDSGNVTADDADGWRINGTRSWYSVTEAAFLAHDTTPDGTDGWRTTTAWQWVSKAEYDAQNTTQDASDGWHDTGAPEWVVASQATDWLPWEGSRPGDQAQYRSTKVYDSPPYDGYDEPVTATTGNDVILARLIAGNDHGVPAIWDGTAYTNTEIADMYVLPEWSQFGTAMEAVALGECGGTLTVRTQLDTGVPASDPFRYQHGTVMDAAGSVIDLEPSVVTTNQQFTSGTFDFAIPGGQYVTVNVKPQNFSELSGYTPIGWSCKAGVTDRSFQPVALDGTDLWQGVRVQVAANEAVSCTLTVAR